MIRVDSGLYHSMGHAKEGSNQDLKVAMSRFSWTKRVRASAIFRQRISAAETVLMEAPSSWRRAIPILALSSMAASFLPLPMQAQTSLPSASKYWSL